MTTQNLKEFLINAKISTYAAWDNAVKTKESDDSTTLTYTLWDWTYHDNYFWGEPYWWREVVFYQWKPTWIMTYYWWVESWVDNIWEIYTILQWALKQIPKEAPYRGPIELIQWSYIYKNSYTGTLEQFSWEEIIEFNGIEVYRAKYMWGSINK